MDFDDNQDGFPIQIVKVNPNNTFSLNEVALRNILLCPAVKDRYVCVISIAGAFRQGKSFLLNFFLRYLELECKSAANILDWLEPHHGPLKGFSWKGGDQRHTMGIVMWSKIFLRKLRNGDEVAIILMDTQGTFDNESSYSDCATIFAMSTLISSLQIYNVMQNIKQDDLAHLECFAGFGNCIKNDAFPFQNLLFLVRDWVWPNKKPYGIRGGEQKLSEILGLQDNLREEVKARRRNIQQLFKKIQCFLMPKPGPAVAEEDDENEPFDGDLDKINPEFLAQIKKLVPLLIDAKNLEAKRINGEKITATALYEYIVAYTKVFTNDEVPQIESMYIATAEANHKTAVSESLNIYNSLMKEIYEEDSPPLNKIDFDNKHLNSQLKAIENFQKKRKIGNVTMSEKYKTELEKKIADEFSNYKKTNEIKLNKEHLKIQSQHKQIVNDEIDFYKDSMNNIYDDEIQYLDEREFERKEAEIRRKVIDSYYAKTERSDHELKRSYLKELEDELNDLADEYKTRNRLNQKISIGELENNLRDSLDEIKRKYKEFMDTILKENEILVDFDKYHESLKSKLLENYYEQCAALNEIHEKKRAEYMFNLNNIFSELYSTYNDKRIVMMTSYINQVRDEAPEQYRSWMKNRAFGDKIAYYDDDQLQKYHNEAQKYAIDYFKDKLKDCNIEFISKGISDLEKILSTFFYEFKEKNEKNRKINQQIMDEKHDNLSAELITFYEKLLNTELQQNNFNYSAEQFANRQRDIESELIEKYKTAVEQQNLDQNESYLVSFYKKLEELSGKYLKIFNSQLQKFLDKADSEYFKMYHISKTIYERSMMNTINLIITLDLKIEDFKKRHSLAIANAIDMYEIGASALEECNLRSQYRQKLNEDFEYGYSECQRRLNISSTEEIQKVNEKEVRRILYCSVKIYRDEMKRILQENPIFEDEIEFINADQYAKDKSLQYYNKEMANFGAQSVERNLETLQKQLNNSASGFKELHDTRRESDMIHTELVCLHAFSEARGLYRSLLDHLKQEDFIEDNDISSQKAEYKRAVEEDYNSKVPHKYPSISRKFQGKLYEFLNRNRAYKVADDGED